MAKLASVSSGNAPLATFPNNHLLNRRVSLDGTPAAWAPPQKQRALEQLRQAIQEEDWASNYSESRTKIHMQAEWSANPERCSMLQAVAGFSGAKRALEVGSNCGVGTLALAEVLPADGEVVALEFDDFVVNFAKRYQVRSESGHKIKHVAGPAAASLEQLAREARAGLCKSFDLVVVDADKAGMLQYFQLLIGTRELLSKDAVVCVDLTPFKGQPPLRYMKYGFPYRYEAESGQKEIDALRASVAALPDLSSYEFGGMLVVQKKHVK